MSDALWLVLAVIALFGAYRQFCIAHFYFRRLRARRERKAG